MINVPEYKITDFTSPFITTCVPPIDIKQLNTYHEIVKPDYTFKQNVSFKTNLTSSSTIDLNKKTNINVSIMPDYKTNTFQLKIFGQKMNRLVNYISASIRINNSKEIFYVNKLPFKNENIEHFINSTQMKIKLSELKTISIDFMDHQDFNIFKPQENKSFYILWNGPEHNYKHDLQIKNDKTLNLYFKTEYTFLYNGKIESKGILLKIKNKDLFQNKHNQEFLEIINNKNEPYNRLDLKVGKINNVPFSSTKYSSLNSFLDKDTGLVKFIDNTYYDLSKQETLLGFNKDSDSGYILPYNYKGRFYPYVDIDVNQFKLKISWEIIINKAYFDEYFSHFSLKINDSSSSNIDNNLNWKNIPSNFFNDINNEKLNFSYFIDKINEINQENNISQNY